CGSIPRSRPRTYKLDVLPSSPLQLLPRSPRLTYARLPMSKTAFTLIPCGALVLAASMFTLSGCNSAPETRDLMAEEARAQHEERPIAMKGETTFDGGKIDVVATVARGFQRVGKGGAGAHSGAGGAGAERHHWSGGSRQTDAFSDDYSFYEGDSDEQQKEA